MFMLLLKITVLLILVFNVGSVIFEDATEREVKSNNVIKTLPLLENIYSVSFKYKLRSDAVGWRSIITFFGGYEFTELIVRGARFDFGYRINNDFQSFSTFTKPPLNVWTTMTSSQSQKNGVYLFTMFINETIALSAINSIPQSYTNVQIYYGNPSDQPADALIKDLVVRSGNQYNNECSESNPDCFWSNGVCTNSNGSFYCSCNLGWLLSQENDSCADIVEDLNEREIKIYNFIANLPLLQKTFSISFKFKLRSIADCANLAKVLQIFSGNKFFSLSVLICTNTIAIVYKDAASFTYNKLPLNEWTSMQISQNQRSEIYSFTICINGTNYYSSLIANPQLYENIYVDSGTELDPLANGAIKDLIIISGSANMNECDERIRTCFWSKRVCTYSNGSFFSSCNIGWQMGQDKATCAGIDECIGSNRACSSGDWGCTNSNGSLVCSCNKGWKLGQDNVRCVGIDECVGSNRDCSWVDRACSDSNRSLICSCNKGWQLDQDNASCVDIDECVFSNNCSLNAICNNFIGGYNCTCKSGFNTSNGDIESPVNQCWDIDECVFTNNCSLNAICNNFIGGYNCTCKSGFNTSNGDIESPFNQCWDINECIISNKNNCSVNAVCNNLIGGFNCTCKSGFDTSNGGIESQLNQCLVNNLYVPVFPKFRGLSLLVEKNQLQNCIYITTVTIFNGTDIRLLVDFGDGTDVTTIINTNAASVNGVTYNISHSYAACNIYKVTAFVSNFIVSSSGVFNSTFTDSTNITVFCLLSPLYIITVPSVSLNGYIELSLSKSLMLIINQDSGSYRNYSIDWGDATYSYNNQSVMNLNVYSPVSFVVQHVYIIENKYNISVCAMNALEKVCNIFLVNAKNCSAPEVRFYYGTVLTPLTFFLSDEKVFIAFIEKSNPSCEIKNFSFDWNLRSSDLKLVAKEMSSLYQQKVNYTILKNSRKVGLYILSLQYNYGDVSTIYNAYLNITFSPLYIFINNGFFNSIAYTIKIGNESYHQNFTISAISSYDPDNTAVGIQNITFVWRCKVASNFSDAQILIAKFTSLNFTFLGNACFNETWVKIPSRNPYINFSTQQFLEGMNYHIEVCGTKYVGRDVYSNEQNKTGCFVQELLIVARNVPTITLKCVSNCDVKLNFKDRVIYSFDCEDCGYRRLLANWIIEDNTSSFPSELSPQNATTTGFSTPSLVINNDILLENKIYTFTLVVSFADSINQAKFKFTKYTCTKPSLGYCYTNPTKGNALETKFMVVCSNWKDLDGFLSYRFYYDNGQSQRMTLSSTTTVDYPVLNAATTDQPSFMNFIMGPGDQNNSSIIRIIAKVTGKYQAYTEYNMFIKVYMQNKTMSITDLLNETNLNDTQSVANLVQAISITANINSMNYLNNPSSFDTNQFSYLQELRTQMITLLNSLPIIDLSSFQSVCGALVVTTQNPFEVSPQAQNIAGNIVIKLAELLTENNLKGFGADRFDSVTQSFVNSISNLLNASLNNNNTGIFLTNPTNHVSKKPTLTGSGKIQDQIEEKVNLISKLMKSMDSYFIAAHSYKVPNENKTVGVTSQFSFVLQKTFPSYLTNSSIGSNDGGFFFPDAKDMFNEFSKYTQILINNVRMKDIIYTWDTNRSQNIYSESQSLSFFGLDGRPINMSNISKPINITLKNIPEKFNGKNISLLMPYDVYQVKLPLKSDCNMLLKFLFLNDKNNLTNLIVYIQYGKIATKFDYDIMLNISEKDGVVMMKNSEAGYLYVTSDNKTNVTSYKNFTRNQDIHCLDDGTIILWNFFKSTYSLLNKSELNLMLSYSGPMPPKQLDLNSYTFDEEEYSGTFDYEIKSFCVECNYWNRDANRWMSDGCQVDVHSTSFLMTKSISFHSGTFGGFYFAPTLLSAISISRLKTGYVILLAVVFVILLWVLGIIVIRRIDKNDFSKFDAWPLVDNLPNNNYLYQITVTTGSRRNGGTNSNIFFTVFGDTTDSGVRYLNNHDMKCFHRGSLDVFLMATHSTLGDLDFIRIWHDNSGGGWYVKNIIITDLQTQKKFVFMGHRWIAIDHGLCELNVVIPVASTEEITNFTYVFHSKALHKLCNEHTWLSLFFCSPKSNFTKCQRFTVAVSLILTSMMISAMYYGKESSGEAAVEHKNDFLFTWKQVFVVFISTCIEILFHLLFVKLFCIKRPFKYLGVNTPVISLNINNKSREPSCAHIYENINLYLKNTELCIAIEGDKPNVNKKKEFHHWRLYIAWFVVVGNILGCSVIAIWYGMLFGNQKSLKWLTSVAINFINGRVLIEPFKIYLTVIIMIFLNKKFGDDEEASQIEMQGKSLASDENWLHNSLEKLNVFDKNEIKMQPLDYSTVENMRKLRLKHHKMKATITELILYIFNAYLVFYIGYSAHDKVSFYQTRNVQELFNLKVRPSSNPDSNVISFQLIKSSKDFWFWMDDVFITQAFPEPWYNFSDFPGKLFLNDLTSKIVNGIRIRQIRVKPNSCTKPNSVAKFMTKDCLSPYKSSLEETSDFDLNWNVSKQNKSPIDLSTMPWRYQTWQELDGYPYTTDLDTYYGGGYIVEMFPKWKNQTMLHQAKKSEWVDRQTRALIIEFALFNAASNCFTMVTMMFDFPASGGAIPSYSVLTFKLYSSAKFGFHILFIFVIIIFITRECRFLYRNGYRHLLNFWNLVEVAMILFSIAVVGFFFYKDYLAKLLLQRLPSKKPQKFINFQFASYWDLMYDNIISMVIFCVTLKFIKLMQFNRRVSMISYTLKSAWYPLFMLGIVFFIFLVSFYFLSMIAFGAFMEEYNTNIEAIASIVSLLLGKFSFSQYKNANSVLGPIFFFGFNVIVIWIIMNMLVSILNDAFLLTREKPDYQNNDFEIIEYILENLKDLLGYRSTEIKLNLSNQYQNAVQSDIEVFKFDVERKSNLKKRIFTKKNVYLNEENDHFYTFESKATLIDDTFSKNDYLLNESELETDVKDELDQILKTKLIQCVKLVNKL